jgi:hypothetical protein
MERIPCIIKSIYIAPFVRQREKPGFYDTIQKTVPVLLQKKKGEESEG